MKSLSILSIILFMGILLFVGCNNIPTTPPETPTPVYTSTPTSTPTATPTLTPDMTIRKATLFTVASAGYINDKLLIPSYLLIGAVEVVFNTQIKIFDFNTKDATHYFAFFCDNNREDSWDGDLYINPYERDKVVIVFNTNPAPNFSCQANSRDLGLVAIAGTIPTESGGYIKGILSSTTFLPFMTSVKTYGGVYVEEGEPESGFDLLNLGNWHIVTPSSTPPLGP